MWITVSPKAKTRLVGGFFKLVVPDSESYPRLRCCLLLVLLVFFVNSAPTKAPIKNRFSFVMVITKNRYLANEASLCVESGLHIVDGTPHIGAKKSMLHCAGKPCPPSH